jgi:hypothetical protein
MRWDIPFGENTKSRAHRRKLRELPHQKPVPPAKPAMPALCAHQFLDPSPTDVATNGAELQLALNALTATNLARSAKTRPQ